MIKREHSNNKIIKILCLIYNKTITIDWRLTVNDYKFAYLMFGKNQVCILKL